MFNPQDCQQPRRNGRLQPEVVERETAVPHTSLNDLNLAFDPATQEPEDLPSFKVFLKKNLPYQQPPTDLLARIQDRVEQIKADRNA